MKQHETLSDQMEWAASVIDVVNQRYDDWKPKGHEYGWTSESLRNQAKKWRAEDATKNELVDDLEHQISKVLNGRDPRGIALRLIDDGWAKS